MVGTDDTGSTRRSGAPASTACSGSRAGAGEAADGVAERRNHRDHRGGAACGAASGDAEGDGADAGKAGGGGAERRKVGIGSYRGASGGASGALHSSAAGPPGTEVLPSASSSSAPAGAAVGVGSGSGSTSKPKVAGSGSGAGAEAGIAGAALGAGAGIEGAPLGAGPDGIAASHSLVSQPRVAQSAVPARGTREATSSAPSHVARSPPSRSMGSAPGTLTGGSGRQGDGPSFANSSPATPVGPSTICASPSGVLPRSVLRAIVKFPHAPSRTSGRIDIGELA